MRDFVVRLRQPLNPEFKNLTLQRNAAGSQPLVLWKNRHYATNRMRYAGGARHLFADPSLQDEPRTKASPNDSRKDDTRSALAIPTDEATRGIIRRH